MPADAVSVMTDRCIKCSAPVPEDDGYENSIGETMCNTCYVELFNAKAVPPAPTIEEWALNALDKMRSSLA